VNRSLGSRVRSQPLPAIQSRIRRIVSSPRARASVTDVEVSLGERQASEGEP